MVSKVCRRQPQAQHFWASAAARSIVTACSMLPWTAASAASDASMYPPSGKALVQQPDDTRVDDAVANAGAVTNAAQNALVSQALKLVRDGLRFHPDRLCKPCNRDTRPQHKGVQQPQARSTGEHLECPLKGIRLSGRNELPLAQGRSGVALGTGFCCSTTHISLLHGMVYLSTDTVIPRRQRC